MFCACMAVTDQYGCMARAHPHSLTRFGAAQPMAAESAVIAARAPMAPRNTVNRGLRMAMILVTNIVNGQHQLKRLKSDISNSRQL